VLATLRTIHANPKAAGVRKVFHDPYSNDGHDEGLAGDGLSEWHPSVPTGLVAALPQDWQQGAEHFRRWPEKEHRGVNKGNEFGASRPENRFQLCPAHLATAAINARRMVLGIYAAAVCARYQIRD
jgi:hypothetical protein